MHIRFLHYLFVFLFTTSQTLQAQLADSSAITAQPANTIPTHPISSLRLIVPAAMIGYGVSALHTPVLQNWNKHIHQTVATEKVENRITIDNYLQWSPAIAVYGLNLAGIKGKHNFTERTFLFGIANLIQGGATHVIKRMSNEMRPDFSNTHSFPSGHTATAFANAEFMRMEYKDVSVWYGVAGYAAATATGYLRLYNNRHWLSDVIAGAGVGILSTQAAYYLYPMLKRLVYKPRHTPAIY